MLTEDQIGFRLGRGTKEMIQVLKMVTERRIDKGKQTFPGFVDIAKMSVNVKWEKLFKALINTEVDFWDREIIWRLYENETALTNFGKTQEEAKIQKGVR